MAHLLKKVFCLGEDDAPFKNAPPDVVRKEVIDDPFFDFTGGKGRFEKWRLGKKSEVLFVGAPTNAIHTPIAILFAMDF